LLHIRCGTPLVAAGGAAGGIIDDSEVENF
jgi:hypothetical protein